MCSQESSYLCDIESIFKYLQDGEGYNRQEWSQCTQEKQNEEKLENVKENVENVIDLANADDDDDFNSMGSFDTEIKAESHYICEAKFPLVTRGNIHVAVGLSAVRGFYPAIRLTGVKNKHISFIHAEWRLLVHLKETIINHFSGNKRKRNDRGCHFCNSRKKQNLKTLCNVNEDEDVKPIVEVFNDCYLLLNKKSTVTLKKNGICIDLNKKSVENLCKLMPIIESKISSLESLQFFDFYNQCIAEVCRLNKQCTVDEATEILSSIQFDTSEVSARSIESLLEISVYFKDKLKEHLEAVKLSFTS